MSTAEFLAKVDEILELPSGTLKGEEKLEDLENWDSVAMVSFIALVDERNGARLNVKQLGACETVNDLLKLAGVQ
jgi:acyl carrier protein